MPRDGSGTYSLPAGVTADATAGTTITSAKYKEGLNDIVDDLNAARPIVKGGTGATTLAGAQTALAIQPWNTVQRISSNTTAVANTAYEIDTSSGAVTLTLPASPADKDWVSAADVTGSSDVNAITIARNGKTIAGFAEDMTITTAHLGCKLRYNSAAGDWRLAYD